MIVLLHQKNFLVPTLIPPIAKEAKQDHLHSPLHPSVQDPDGWMDRSEWGARLVVSKGGVVVVCLFLPSQEAPHLTKPESTLFYRAGRGLRRQRVGRVRVQRCIKQSDPRAHASAGSQIQH